MAKNIKMIVYGEPGVGKSTFAAGAPRPFFITTDGNYEYLEDFCGMKPEDHQQCFSWAEMKKAFARDFSNYDTNSAAITSCSIFRIWAMAKVTVFSVMISLSNIRNFLHFRRTLSLLCTV